MVTGCVTDAGICHIWHNKEVTYKVQTTRVGGGSLPAGPAGKKEGAVPRDIRPARGPEPNWGGRGKRFPRLCVYRVMLHWRGKTLGLCVRTPAGWANKVLIVIV